MPTSSSARTVLSPALVVLVAACALLTTAVALAGPAAAIEDPRRPAAEVTHGPSCGPGVVRVAVTNGTVAHRVALVFDDGVEQDAAELAGAEQAELTSDDVDWGQTVDVSLTVTAADGTVEDPIEFGTYTRPSAEDCAAIDPTTTPSTEPDTSAPAPSSTATTVPSTTASDSSTPTRPRPSWPTPSRPSSQAPAPVPDSPRPTPPPVTTASSSAGGAGGQAGNASAASVSPGGVVTVRATGFAPGEAVTVSLLGVDDPLTTVTAGEDGSVEAVVQIPRGAALGTATVQLVGARSSAIAGLALQVAARSVPVAERTTSVPVLAAGFSLIGAAAALGLTAARRSRGQHSPTPR